MKKFVFLLALLFSLALATSYPLVVTDDLGRTVTIPAEPQRIVVMLPSATETLCAVGACDRIVATDDYSNWPAEVADKPKAGGLYNPNVELIASFEPDLVITSKYGKLTEALDKLGLTTYAVNTQTFEDIFRTARNLGELVNREAEAEALVARINREVYALESQAAKAGDRPTVYYEIDATPYTVGPGSFIGTLIKKARGVNVIPAELGLFPKISPELVVEKDPAVIVLGDAPYGVTATKIAERPGWAALQAVRSGRVCELTKEQTDVVHRPGPRVAEGLRVLIDCFHPGLLGE
ncbi:ABC transporter substrate-binding protein [Oceanithermus desulfurans]|uniref:ABC transporter substrate-binding protein n=2 Tax=Oceanithermus desulfurans TaxID=227924 RepID=A0A511RLV2_9DEIN|nr:ABC transporter substrate-binding protein [Oceanithermus desulfurans]MBB6029815.1 iron complex transport system substrate-binding protein [Oceanithermus desulfurans]GEM89776.1 ABC transporter substrate-binding protein [Oceanithermus desulfurans NBRC 100063]